MATVTNSAAASHLSPIFLVSAIDTVRDLRKKEFTAYVAWIRHLTAVSVQDTALGRGYAWIRVGYPYLNVPRFLQIKIKRKIGIRLGHGGIHSGYFLAC